jgi:hypothetical protein
MFKFKQQGYFILLLILLLCILILCYLGKQMYSRKTQIELFANDGMTLIPTNMSNSLPIYFKGLVESSNQGKLPYLTKIEGKDALIFPKAYTLSDASNPFTYFVVKDVQSGQSYDLKLTVYIAYSPNQQKLDSALINTLMNQYSSFVFFNQDNKQFALPIKMNWTSSSLGYTFHANITIPNWFTANELNFLMFYTPNIADFAIIEPSFTKTLVTQGTTLPMDSTLMNDLTWLNVAKQTGDTVNEYQWTNELNPSQFIQFRKGLIYTDNGYLLINGAGQFTAFDVRPYMNSTTGYTISMYVRSVEDLQNYPISTSSITEDGNVVPKMLVPFVQLNNPILFMGTEIKNYLSIEFPIRKDVIKIQLSDKIYTTSASYEVNQFRQYSVTINPTLSTLTLYRDTELLQTWNVPRSDMMLSQDGFKMALNPFGRQKPGAQILQTLAFFKKEFQRAELERLQVWNQERLTNLYQYTMTKWDKDVNQTFTEIQEPILTYLNKYYATEMAKLIELLKSRGYNISTPTQTSSIGNGATSISGGQTPPVPSTDSSTSPNVKPNVQPSAPSSGSSAAPNNSSSNISDMLSIFNEWASSQLMGRSKTQQSYISPETLDTYQTCYRSLIDQCYNTRNFQGCYQTFQEQNQDTCKDFFKMVQDDKCPNASYRDGTYWIFYPALRQWKSISKNQDYARLVYAKNYPNCPIPNVLKKQEPEFQEKEGICPYYFNDRNPCLQKECEGVQWKSARDIEKAPMECKREIVHYCETYKDTDPNCICWNKKYENKPACIEFRRKLGDRRSVSCKPNDFPIEQHPDIEKYIRKDNIPCWGCNLDSKK